MRFRPTIYRRPRGRARTLPGIVLLGTMLVLGPIFAGCGASSSSGRSSITQPTGGADSTAAQARRGVPNLSHIAIVVMENEEASSVIDNNAAPYVNRLAQQGALATSSYAVTHPSLPNYLSLTGGSTFGIESDCTDCHVAGRNLVDELEGAGISWKAYMQDMPAPCFTGASSGKYAKKHDPFLYYDDIRLNPGRCAKVVPALELDKDLTTGALPRFAWITPNMCNDMHDCDVAAGDRYLAGLIPRLIAAVGPSGAVFVTWDEGASDNGCCSVAAGGRIVTIATGGAVRRHARVAVRYDHYSLLRTIEDAWRLPELGYASCSCTLPMRALLHSR